MWGREIRFVFRDLIDLVLLENFRYWSKLGGIITLNIQYIDKWSVLELFMADFTFEKASAIRLLTPLYIQATRKQIFNFSSSINQPTEGCLFKR